jgi:hypothetical protein
MNQRHYDLLPPYEPQNTPGIKKEIPFFQALAEAIVWVVFITWLVVSMMF